MIDIEVKVFNRAHARAAPLCAKNGFVSVPITEMLTAFPAGSLYELENHTDRPRQSSTPIENYAVITYQLEVYATTKSGCRKVYAAVDDEMISMNFNRISGDFLPAPNGNTKLFRYVARYEALVDRYGNLYRRR